MNLHKVILFFVYAIMPMAAYCQTTVEGISYKILSQANLTANVASNPGLSGDVTIPSSFESNGKTYSVIGFEENAFKDNNLITSVTISEGILTISKNAFQSCANLKKVSIPSTVTSIEGRAFSSTENIEDIYLYACMPDGDNGYKGIQMQGDAFTKNVLSKATLHVPMKLYQWYCDFWGNERYTHFSNISPIAINPSRIKVTFPNAKSADDYQALNVVKIQYSFDEADMEDCIGLPSDGEHELIATLYPGGLQTIKLSSKTSPNSFNASNNAIIVDFTELLESRKKSFVAKPGEDLELDVDFELEGAITIQGYIHEVDNDKLTSASTTINLIPAVYELPDEPVVTPSTEAVLSAEDFTNVQLNFGDMEPLPFDGTEENFFHAKLYKGEQLLKELTAKDVTISAENHSLTIVLPDLTEELLVRRATGIESFEFSLDMEGQMNFGDEKKYHFEVARKTWTVASIIIPEPTSLTLLPAAGTLEVVHALDDVQVVLEGVENVTFPVVGSAASETEEAEAPLAEAVLVMNGKPLATVGADKMRFEGNVIHVDFSEYLDEDLVTLITSESDVKYDFDVEVVADVMTDGFPWQLEVKPDGDAPRWSVAAIAKPLPEATVSLWGISGEGNLEYTDLHSINIKIDNYDTVAFGESFSASIQREGTPVATITSEDVTISGNVITLDFSKALTNKAVGITPHDDASQPVVLSLQVKADLLFDGYNYMMCLPADEESALQWNVLPVVFGQLTAPTVTYTDGRISFSTSAPGATFHYSVSNADDGLSGKLEARKLTTGGGSASLSLTRAYIITVYASADGYDDSPETTVTLHLDAAPVITTGTAK